MCLPHRLRYALASSSISDVYSSNRACVRPALAICFCSLKIYIRTRARNDVNAMIIETHWTEGEKEVEEHTIVSMH